MIHYYKPMKENAVAELIRRYNQSTSTQLTHCYAKPSDAKIYSYNRIIRRVRDSVGPVFYASHPVKIVSYNTFVYCVAYLDVDENGELMLCLETPTTIYACPCPVEVL